MLLHHYSNEKIEPFMNLSELTTDESNLILNK